VWVRRDAAHGREAPHSGGRGAVGQGADGCGWLSGSVGWARIKQMVGDEQCAQKKKRKKREMEGLNCKSEWDWNLN
jgi:hypothetical protein